MPTTSCELAYDSMAGIDFLTELRGGGGDGYQEFRAFQDGTPRQKWTQTPGRETAWVNQQINANRDVYVGIAARKEGFGDNKHLLYTDWLWVEIDLKNNGGDLRDIVDRLNHYPRRPWMINHSGGGLHVYYRIKRFDLTTQPGESVKDKGYNQQCKHLKAVLTRLIDDTGASPESKDPARILRLRGTWNFKPEYGTPRPVSSYQGANTAQIVYDIAAFPLPTRATVHRQDAAPRDENSSHTATPEELLRRAIAESHAKNSRHKGGVWLACQLRDNRYPRAEAEGVMQTYQQHVDGGTHPYSAEEAFKTLEDCFASAPRSAWETPDVPTPGRAEPKTAQPPLPDDVPPTDLHQALRRMEKQLQRRGAAIHPCGLSLPPNLDREDLQSIGASLKYGTDHVTTVLNFLWADWYAGLPTMRGAKIKMIMDLYGGADSLKGLNEQKRLSELASVAKRIPQEYRTMERPWSLYERIARLASLERRLYWLQQKARKGIGGEIDSEIQQERTSGAQTAASARPAEPGVNIPPHLSLQTRNTTPKDCLPISEKHVDELSGISESSSTCLSTYLLPVRSDVAQRLQARANGYGLSVDDFLEALLDSEIVSVPDDTPVCTEISEPYDDTPENVSGTTVPLEDSEKVTTRDNFSAKDSLQAEALLRPYRALLDAAQSEKEGWEEPESAETDENEADEDTTENETENDVEMPNTCLAFLEKNEFKTSRQTSRTVFTTVKSDVLKNAAEIPENTSDFRYIQIEGEESFSPTPKREAKTENAGEELTPSALLPYRALRDAARAGRLPHGREIILNAYTSTSDMNRVVLSALARQNAQTLQECADSLQRGTVFDGF